MKTIRILYSLLLFISLIITGCEKILEKDNPEAINPNIAWNDLSAATAYVTEIYADLMPSFSTNDGRNTDEALGAGGSMESHLKGTSTIDTWNFWSNYDAIRKINYLFDQIDKGTLSEESKSPVKGQAYFWRAWAYFNLVKAYGGVPLILKPQYPNDADLFLPRNKTSECITQIIADLDNAIASLPLSWGSTDIGRIDKNAAMAFKGRVLLYYASPQFNPLNNVARWQAAYDANKAAMDTCIANGKGLHSDFAKIWYENTKEAIMVHYYRYPEHTYSQAGDRPMKYTVNAWGWDMPTLDLVNAFPMKDGSKYDITAGYDKLWQNRDDRFYATIVYNGFDYGIKDLVEIGAYMWTWHSPDVLGMDDILGSPSSFYRNKGIDKTIDLKTTKNATIPWIEIRFAEVLMNFGEAANEIGKTDEALDVLQQIRARAGILPGADNKYGLTATTLEEVRTAYMDERFVEFAFESKRFWDLRRLRRFDVLNNLITRHGLLITLLDPTDPPLHKEDINVIYNRFEVKVQSLDNQPINVRDQYYFFGIPKSILDQNSKLEQTQGWDGGTFDPLL